MHHIPQQQALAEMLTYHKALDVAQLYLAFTHSHGTCCHKGGFCSANGHMSDFLLA